MTASPDAKRPEAGRPAGGQPPPPGKTKPPWKVRPVTAVGVDRRFPGSRRRHKRAG